MSDNLESKVDVQIPSPNQVRSGSRAWLWILLAFFIIIVAPVVGCGAFGLAFALASPRPAQTGIGPAVGVIRVEGVIFTGGSSGLSTGADSETIVNLIQKADQDSSVKAIVLRVDSPGGGVVASDEIYHALVNVDKPVVVSMGSMAASGGYYISAPADYIYATPHTITGSIGVISQFVTAEELLDEVGVEVIVITAGDVKDFGSFHRDMTDEEREYWQSLINDTHAAFIQIVAEGRGMDEETVRALADGRVYTGSQALELGLVDEIGYFEDAIAKAADLGGISGEPRIIEFEPEYDFWNTLYGLQAQQSTPFTFDLLRQLATPTLEFRYLGP